MKTVRFFYVRHGQTIFNLTEKAQGWCDSPLTPLGVQQAEETGQKLKDTCFDRCYCSDLTRARETAEYICRYQNCPIIPCKGLREFNFGMKEGELYTHHYENGVRIRWSKLDYTDMLGENPEIFDRRIRETLDGLVEETEDGDQILLVGHRGYCTEIMELLFNIDIARYEQVCRSKGLEPIPNGSVMIFENTDHKYSLKQLPGLEDFSINQLQK
ncbi:MAG: histidine phosphatase family protein [Erysipelotrichaceae bacterium]|nr:histidine phosphatase family protein [Erysipelotrichaceae bacterium]